MESCHLVEIETPKKYRLNGLWFGPRKAKRAIVWVHGLGSSMFSKQEIVQRLTDRETAVLVFNNRGHDKVTSVSSTSGRRIRAGAAHEIFTDCVDDIQGAVNLARRAGAKEVFLAGHSTGCQKSIYYASKKPRGVRGVIILAPMSDYDAERLAQGTRALKRAEKVARSYIKRGNKHQMLPEDVWRWPWIADAQRFLALYTGEGPEEIFTYWNHKRTPKTLRSVRTPVLVLLAEKEEYSKIPADHIQDWFAEHLKVGDKIVIVPKVGHSFKGGEKRVTKAVREFMKGTAR
jgi:alpha-beta hydrolase superfamily lysophospholipase